MIDGAGTTDSDTNSNQKLVTQCPECLSGVMHVRYLTYFTWLNEELVTVSNFPAWVCDLCGRREYDPRAVKWLNILLNPETGRSVSKRRGDRPGAELLPPQS